MLRRTLLAVLALLVGGTGLATAARADDVTVFAAASLKDSLDAINADWRKASGKHATISYAASSALAKQIEAAAPADVFISADLDWMDYLDKKGLIAPGTRHNLLGNVLVLIAPADGKAGDAQNLAAKLRQVPGVAEAVVIAEDKLAYLKVDSRSFDAKLAASLADAS